MKVVENHQGRIDRRGGAGIFRRVHDGGWCVPFLENGAMKWSILILAFADTKPVRVAAVPLLQILGRELAHLLGWWRPGREPSLWWHHSFGIRSPGRVAWFCHYVPLGGVRKK